LPCTFTYFLCSKLLECFNKSLCSKFCLIDKKLRAIFENYVVWVEREIGNSKFQPNPIYHDKDHNTFWCKNLKTRLQLDQTIIFWPTPPFWPQNSSLENWFNWSLELNPTKVLNWALLGWMALVLFFCFLVFWIFYRFQPNYISHLQKMNVWHFLMYGLKNIVLIISLHFFGGFVLEFLHC
jgi:hypothetical protein